MFQVALALLKLNEKALLDCDSAAGVYSYLNGEMTHQGISIDGLIRESDGMRHMVKRADVEKRRENAVKRELADMVVSEGEDGRDGGMKVSLVIDPLTAPVIVTTPGDDEDTALLVKPGTLVTQDHPLAPIGPKNETIDESAGESEIVVAETAIVPENPLAIDEAAIGPMNETVDDFAEAKPLVVMIEDINDTAAGNLETVASLSSTEQEKSESPAMSPTSSPPSAAAAATLLSTV